MPYAGLASVETCTPAVGFQPQHNATRVVVGVIAVRAAFIATPAGGVRASTGRLVHLDIAAPPSRRIGTQAVREGPNG